MRDREKAEDDVLRMLYMRVFKYNACSLVAMQFYTDVLS
jgi:hypothetical protein